MKKQFPLIIAVVFCFLTLGLVAKSIALSRETSMIVLDISARKQQVQQSPGGAAEPQSYEVISVRQAVQGIAWHYNLPLVVEQQKNTLMVTPPVAAVKEDGKKEEFAVLKDYEAVLGFLSGISTLPYKLDVKQLCVGTECTGGFVMMAEVKAK